MGKILLLVVVVLAAVWWLRGLGRTRQPGPPPKTAHRPPGTGAAGPANMLACAHCGVHLPQAEALTDTSGRLYCGEAHRAAGPR